MQLAPSVFLASAAVSSNLVSQIFPARLQSLLAPYLDVALWMLPFLVGVMAMISHLPWVHSTACVQKTWDATIVSTAAESLLENAPDDLAPAHLLASSSKEPGAWLHALPPWV